MASFLSDVLMWPKSNDLPMFLYLSCKNVSNQVLGYNVPRKLEDLISYQQEKLLFQGRKVNFFFEGLGVEFPILISNFDNL